MDKRITRFELTHIHVLDIERELGKGRYEEFIKWLGDKQLVMRSDGLFVERKKLEGFVNRGD